ncbi:MAG: hypothetical protein KDA87_23380, partial [Planctomycetales bacterium]|nr:hypothetical protein [Planctomycetales bacterium]
ALDAKGVAESARIESEASRLDAVQQRKRADAKADEARLNLYAADMLGAGQYLKQGNLHAARELLANHIPKNGDEDLRGWEWRYFREQSKGDHLFRLGEHRATVNHVEFSPNADYVLSSCGTEIVLWNLQAKAREHTWDVLTRGCGFTSDGEKIGILRASGTLELWDVSTREPVMSCPETMNGFRMSPDFPFAYIVSNGGLKRWDFSDNTVAELFSSTDSVTIRGSSADGTKLCLSVGKELLIWDTEQQAVVRRVKMPFGNEPQRIAFLPNENGIIATQGLFRTPAVYRFDKQEWQEPFPQDTIGTYRIVATRDGRHLISCSFDHSVAIWDASTLDRVSSYFGHADEVFDVAVSRDGRWIASGSQDRYVHIWPREVNELPEQVASTVGPMPPVFSANGQWVALSVRPFMNSQIFDTKTLERLRTISAAPIQSLASLGEDVLVTVPIKPGPPGSLVTPDRYRVWDSQWQKEERPIFTNGAKGSGFAADDDLFAINFDDGKVRLFDFLDASKPLGEFSVNIDREVSRTILVPMSLNKQSGKIALAGKDSETNKAVIKIVDTRSGAVVVMKSPHRKDISDIEWTPDGKMLISVSFFNDIVIWDPETGRIRNVLKGHRRGINACDISPDGKTLATASHDGTIKLWHLATGRELATLDFMAFELAFSPDGQTLGAVSFDFTTSPISQMTQKETFRIWRAPTDHSKSQPNVDHELDGD